MKLYNESDITSEMKEKVAMLFLSDHPSPLDINSKEEKPIYFANDRVDVHPFGCLSEKDFDKFIKGTSLFGFYFLIIRVCPQKGAFVQLTTVNSQKSQFPGRAPQVAEHHSRCSE